MRHPRRTQTESQTPPSDPDSLDLSSLLSSLSPVQINRAKAVQSRFDRINEIILSSDTSKLYSELFELEGGRNFEVFRQKYIQDGQEDIQFTREYLFAKLDYEIFKSMNAVEDEGVEVEVYDGSEMKQSLSKFLTTWYSVILIGSMIGTVLMMMPKSQSLNMMIT
jgi:hypothetical protein